jgi:putative nucleotidyltransferase with HDIG domain
MEQTQETPAAEALANLRKIAGKTGDLPPMPVTALSALRMTDDPNVSARDLQTVIARDQALSARILRIVNSPMYGLRAEISTVSHAVAILGLDTLRSIIMAATVNQVFQSSRVRGHDLTAKLLGDHSWGAAVAARKVAQLVRFPKAEEAFLCGLMHDIGKIVLLQNFQAHYAEIISRVYQGNGSFHAAEMEFFGFSHAHVGALLAEKWNFPPQLWEAIGYHHNPTSAPNHARLASITSLADALMIRMELGFERNGNLDLAALPAAESLGLRADALENLLQELRTMSLETPAPRRG